MFPGEKRKVSPPVDPQEERPQKLSKKELAQPHQCSTEVLLPAARAHMCGSYVEQLGRCRHWLAVPPRSAPASGQSKGPPTGTQSFLTLCEPTQHGHGAAGEGSLGVRCARGTGPPGLQRGQGLENTTRMPAGGNNASSSALCGPVNLPRHPSWHLRAPNAANSSSSSRLDSRACTGHPQREAPLQPDGREGGRGTLFGRQRAESRHAAGEETAESSPSLPAGLAWKLFLENERSGLVQAVSCERAEGVGPLLNPPPKAKAAPPTSQLSSASAEPGAGGGGSRTNLHRAQTTPPTPEQPAAAAEPGAGDGGSSANLHSEAVAPPCTCEAEVGFATTDLASSVAVSSLAWGVLFCAVDSNEAPWLAGLCLVWVLLLFKYMFIFQVPRCARAFVE